MTLGLALLVALAGCGSAHRAAAHATATTAGPLVAPKTSPAQDSEYFQDLATTDPSLSTYVDAQQGVALQALLTDGSAFCAFLNRGGGIDDAMESEIIGANSVEAQTHLPASVQTYNAIDSAALIALCPDEQRLIPAADQAHIQQLESQLAGHSTLASP